MMQSFINKAAHKGRIPAVPPNRAKIPPLCMAVGVLMHC